MEANVPPKAFNEPDASKWSPAREVVYFCQRLMAAPMPMADSEVVNIVMRCERAEMPSYGVFFYGLLCACAAAFFVARFFPIQFLPIVYPSRTSQRHWSTFPLISGA